MHRKVAPGVNEIAVAAEREYVARSIGSGNFAFSCMVGSGIQSNAVVPTATGKLLKRGELVMLGLALRYNGYAGVFGETLSVSGTFTQSQRDTINVAKETYCAVRDMLRPGYCGKQIERIGATIYAKHGLSDYIVCPFLHAIGQTAFLWSQFFGRADAWNNCFN